MRSLNLIKIIFVFLIFCLTNPGLVLAKLNVVTTTEDIASIVKEVGGDLVEVQTIVKGTQDAHIMQARPSFMLKVNRADLLVYQGLQLEVGWLPLLVQNARNKKVLPGRPGQLDVSVAIEPLNVPLLGQLDRSLGDVHPLGNPHYHLNPQNGLLMADIIADRLTQLDPDHADAFRNNLEHFRTRLEKKIKEWKERMGKFQNLRVVIYHTSWNYLLDFFSIESIGTMENRPGIPPSGRHLAELATLMNQSGTRVILQANYFENEYSDLLAAKTQATVLVLPVSVGGVKEAHNYIALFDILVDKMEKAFEKNQSFSKNKIP